MTANINRNGQNYFQWIGGGALLAAALLFISSYILNMIAIRLINEHYPPKSSVELQAESINASYKALSEIKSPSLAFALSTDTLSNLLTDSISGAGKQSTVHVSDLSVSGEQQQIRISADFEGRFDDYSATVKGQLDGVASIAIENNDLVVTPAFDRVRVSSLSVDGWHFPSALSNGLIAALTKILDNYNGTITPATIKVAKELLAPQKVDLGDKTFTIPAQELVAQSLLVDGGKVIWIAQINGNKLGQTSEAVSNFDTLKQAFVAKGGDLLASAPKDGLVFAKDYLNGLVALAGLNLSPADKAKASLEAAWAAVHHLSGPDASVILPSAALEKLVLPVLSKAIDEQAAKSKLTVTERRLKLTDGRIGVVFSAKADLPEPIGGTLTFRLGVGVAPVIAEGRISLLPSIDEISIQEVSSAKFDAAKAVTSVNAVISGLITGLNQVFPAIPVEIDPFEIDAVDLKKSAEGTPGLTLTPSIIPAMKARFTAGAMLITPEAIQILADLDIDSPSLAARAAGNDPAPFSGSVADIQTAFAQRREATLTTVDLKKLTVDLSWARLAQMVNAKWKDLGGIKASYEFDTGSQPMEPTEIRLVDKPTYTCEQKSCEQRNCSFNSCADSCSRDSCDWRCGVCVSTPFGDACTPDPVCEAAKLACNVGKEPNYQACRAGCDVTANLDKAQCDAAAVTEKGRCDAEAAVLKAACDVGNAIQDLAQKVGGIGKIGGDTRAIGQVRVDAASLALSDGSPGVTLSPLVSGTVTASGSIDFTPYDIGHLLVCPVKGKASFTVGVTIPEQHPLIQVALNTVETDVGLLRLNAVINSFNMKARLDPAPAEAILTQNPQLLVECNPVLTGITTGLSIIGKARGLSGNDLIKAAGKEASAIFAGDVDYEVKGFSVPIEVKVPEIVLAGQKYAVNPKLEGKVIGASLDY